jgi:hypothetical protein
MLGKAQPFGRMGQQAALPSYCPSGRQCRLIRTRGLEARNEIGRATAARAIAISTAAAAHRPVSD